MADHRVYRFVPSAEKAAASGDPEHWRKLHPVPGINPASPPLPDCRRHTAARPQTRPIDHSPPSTASTSCRAAFLRHSIHPNSAPAAQINNRRWA